MTKIVQAVEQRFLDKTLLIEGHLLWIGSLSHQGYGQFDFNGRTQLAHRVAWVLAGFGEIPDGNHCLHKCGIHACANVFHLKLGTASDNQLDNVRQGRHYWANKTHCHSGHEYTEANTYTFVRADGGAGRYCRECHRKTALAQQR